MALALIQASTALAADPPSQASSPQAPSPQASSPQASPEATGTPQGDASPGNGDITVTARRRNETLQSVPVTMSALGQEQFERLAIKDTTDLNGLSPNVQVARSGAGTGAVQVFIRGVGQDALAFNVENPVGQYLDDVYLGRVQGALLDVLDLDRIEILRGPQGTLYGRNSTVGAVKYITRQPDLEEAHYRGAFTYGNFKRVDATVSASIPIVADKLAVKIDAGVRNRAGYLKVVDGNGNDTGFRDNRIERKSARLALKYQPTSELTVDLSADYSKDTGGSSSGTPLAGCSTTSPSSCANLFGSPYKVGENGADAGYLSSYGFAGRVAYDLGAVTLKSITSYRGLHDFDSIDLGSIPNVTGLLLPDFKRQHQVSQELQASTNGDGPFNVVGGLFYYNENIRHFANFLNIDRVNDHQFSYSYAGYADGTYKLTKRWSIEAGGRYSRDRKELDRSILNGGTGNQLIYTGSSKVHFQKVTYKVGTDYQLTPDILTYVNYGTGYRPGGYVFTYPLQPQIDTGSVLNTTRNETAKNLEAGLKTELLDRHVRLNLAGFITRYIGLQAADTNRPFPIVSKDLHIKGVEADLEAHPIEALTIYANGGYLHSRVVSGPTAGTTQRYIPKIQYTAGGEYRLPLSDDSHIFIGGNVFHTASFRTDDAFIPSVIQPSYTLVNGELGIETDGGRMRLSIDGKNLTDKAYFLSTVPDLARFFAPPRTVSATLSLKI
ncbi:TonB-dependent receptor domain-containing protein [Sphingomonas bacterium]|uniref:TonB-dependent receptor domain-containing protein n=1 Tax=Sphingomonas bacterium TaxID=1895847 RepID=UPI0020C68EAE|nr:TonB-dependent receptor [Sphingomonas bacterium]